ncbi:MAG: hypothetical protein IJH96_04705 [Ruminococcus sp.]|nr:hypothetical protein [Ruminococcus sp.]
MRDVKWQNGDIVLDSAGRAELLSAHDAAFQRAKIRMSARRGRFIYDRELGADCDGIAGEMCLQQYGQAFGEALVPYENTGAKAVALTEHGVRTEITVNGETKTEEVRRYGEL